MNKKENENLETEEVVEEQAVEEQVVEEQVVEPEEELVEEPVVIDPIKVLEEERDDFKDKWMRAAAETENVRKRGRRDVRDSRTFAVADMARDLLEVLDNFDRALLVEDGSAIRAGVEMTAGSLKNMLANRGIKKIDVKVGDEFDPNKHEAVARFKNEEVESNCIVEVVQNGYNMGELVLRAARVAVAE
ncbi:nucleotide exchange factor GrpE [bacterium]|nr:nucleotide exchange factor GrpE [bacterium]